MVRTQSYVKSIRGKRNKEEKKGNTKKEVWEQDKKREKKTVKEMKMLVRRPRSDALKCKKRTRKGRGRWQQRDMGKCWNKNIFNALSWNKV